MKEKRYHLKSSIRRDLVDLERILFKILVQDELEGFEFNTHCRLAPMFYRVFFRYFYLRTISSWFKK